ncbi:cyclic peptide transporter [Variovorax sp. TBS-050B]|nr:cyclic peptide transporter [Variovorax sp. TBS-050B]
MTTTTAGNSAEIGRLLKPFLPWIVLSAVTGVAAGGATVALLGTINGVLNQPGGLAGGLLLTFVGLCGVALFGRMASDVSTNFVGQRLVAQVRKSLAQKILSAPIDALERYRTHRLMPVLSQDVDMISDVAFALSGTLIALAVALGCLGYLAYLSLPLFGLMLLALAIGITVQLMAQIRGEAGFWKAREQEDQLHKAYRAISEGAKELRMHRTRRTRMFAGQIERIVDTIRTVNSRAINTYVIATAFGSALFFLLIALILGWAAFRTTEPAVVSGFVLVLLFLKGPLDQIALTLPGVGRAKVAFQRIGDLSARFATPEPHLHLERASNGVILKKEIGLRGVRYAFDAPEGGEGFTLGPIDLTLRRGEMVFVVGDNGSGKTTLIKLLLGLYAPQAGEVLIDGAVVRPEGARRLPPALHHGVLGLLPVRRPRGRRGKRGRRGHAGAARGREALPGAPGDRAQGEPEERRLHHHRPLHRPAQAPGAGACLPGRAAGAGVRRVGGRPGPDLPPPVLHRTAARTARQGAPAGRDLARRPLLPPGRPRDHHARGPHRRRPRARLAGKPRRVKGANEAQDTDARGSRLQRRLDAVLHAA